MMMSSEQAALQKDVGLHNQTNKLHYFSHNRELHNEVDGHVLVRLV